MSKGTTENNANGELANPTPKTLNVSRAEIRAAIGWTDIKKREEAVTALIETTSKAIIGEDWPTHCDKGIDNCYQCHNRAVLNGQMYEQRQKLKEVLNG